MVPVVVASATPDRGSVELYCCATVVFQNRLEFLGLCGHRDVWQSSVPINVAIRFVRSGQYFSPLSLTKVSRPFAIFSGLECVSHEQDDDDRTTTSAYAVDFWYAESNVLFCKWILGGSSSVLSVVRSVNHGGGGVSLCRLPVPDLCGTWVDPRHRNSCGRASRRYIWSPFGSLSFSGIAAYSADERVSSVDSAAALMPWTFSGTFTPPHTRAPVLFSKVTHGTGADYSIQVVLVADAKYIFWYLVGGSATPENVWTWDESALHGAGHDCDGECDVRCADGRGDCRACADGRLRCGKYQHDIAIDHCLRHWAHGVHSGV